MGADYCCTVQGLYCSMTVLRSRHLYNAIIKWSCNLREQMGSLTYLFMPFWERATKKCVETADCYIKKRKV